MIVLEDNIAEMKKGYRDMTVCGFSLDSVAKTPMVLLRDDERDSSLPIWISAMEAVTVAAELINRDALAQSGSLDLMTMLFEKISVQVRRITLEGLTETTFEAYVTFEQNEELIRVRVRPCEAVVMSLRFSLPIGVSEKVIADSAIMDAGEEHVLGDGDACRFIDLLESLDPKDMGKYPI